jgi:outer membrane protein
MIRFFAALWCFAAISAYADDLLSRADSLIKARKPQAAYELLKAQEKTRAGEFSFDYLLGIAALDSEQAQEAVFALERAVDTDPTNGPARADLARAYLALGETDNAKTEFTKIKREELPPDVSALVDRYLTNIDLYNELTRTRFRPYVEVGVGYDSNVNSATDASLVAVPFLGREVPLDEGAREANSGIWDIGAGVNITSPLSADSRLSLYGGVDFDHRLAVSESKFTSTNSSGQLGLHWRLDRNQFRIGAEAQHLGVDGATQLDSDRQTGGFTGQWQHNFSDFDQITVFSQFSMIRYPEQRVRNVNRTTAGIGYGHAFSGVAMKPVVFISGFGGVENEQNERRGGQFGRHFYGIRGGGQATISERGTVFVSATYQASNHDESDLTFGVTRDDDYFDFNIGYRHQYNRHWSLSPTLRYNNNAANIATSDYDRVEAMMVLRNDF